MLTQSLAILEWLEETRPEPPLLPRGARWTAPRARHGRHHRLRHPSAEQHARGQGKLAAWALTQAAITPGSSGWIGDGFDALEPLIARHGGGCSRSATRPTIADCCLVPQVYSARRFERGPGALAGADRAPRDRAAEHPAFLAAHPNRQPDAET